MTASALGGAALEAVGVYLSLAAGPILTEELAPLLAGAAAARGGIALGPAVATMTVGGWVATTVLYAIGRWQGGWLARRFPRAGTTMEKLLGVVRRRPWRSALLVRYAFGLRLLLPLACGAAHLRADLYLLASFVSSVTWSALFAVLGYWFGQAALAALARVQAYDQYAWGGLVGVALVAWLVLRRRRRAPLVPGEPAGAAADASAAAPLTSPAPPSSVSGAASPGPR